MYASLAVNSTQMLPAMPVRIIRRTRRVSSSVSSVVSKKLECFGFSMSSRALGRSRCEMRRPGDVARVQCSTVCESPTAIVRGCR